MKQPSLNLPRKYLSYSQMAMWQRNKDQYRKRYYLNEPALENKETIFGKRFARIIETWEKDKLSPNWDPKKLGYSDVEIDVFERTPKYPSTEHRFELPVLGVPFLGVADSFHPETFSIIELKTGKEPWTNLRVQKHDQLVVYSLLSKLKYKAVDPVVKLSWIETRYKPERQQLGTRSFEGESNILELTGKIETFERKIAEWERVRLKNLIWEIANEISQDFTAFQATL